MKIFTAKLFLPLFLLLISFQIQAQRGESPDRVIKGRVLEGPTQNPMIGANVLIKTVNDSLLVGTVTGVNGTFELTRPDIPTVVVEISYLGYQKIKRTHNRNDALDLGDIGLVEDSKLLGEVVIEGQVRWAK